MSKFGGLSSLAAFALTLTAAAPVGAVWLCAYTPTWGWRAVAAAGGLVLVLMLVCGGLLGASARRLAREPLSLETVANADTEIVGFLVAYAMPLLVGPPDYQPAPLIAFTLFLVLAVWRTQAVHVNPLASLLGYHFYRARAASGVDYIIVSRRWNLTPASITAVRLSRGLWLELDGPLGGPIDDQILGQIDDQIDDQIDGPAGATDSAEAKP